MLFKLETGNPEGFTVFGLKTVFSMSRMAHLMTVGYRRAILNVCEKTGVCCNPEIAHIQGVW